MVLITLLTTHITHTSENLQQGRGFKVTINQIPKSGIQNQSGT